MDTSYLKAIQKWMRGISNGERVSNFLLVRHFYEHNLNAELSPILSMNNEMNIINFQYNEADVIQTCEPFLSWMKEQIAEEDMDHIFQECNIFLQHKDIFRTYFLKGKCKRKEPILDDHFEFEKDRILNGILSMLKYVANREFKKNGIPILFVLDKLHRCDKSSFEVIHKFFEDEKLDHIYFLIGYNNNYKVKAYFEADWSDMLEQAEGMGIVADVFQSEEVSNEQSRVWRPDWKGLRECLVAIHNKIEFLFIDESMHYLDIIYQKMSVEKNGITELLEFDVFRLQVKVLMILKKFNEALLMCDKMQDVVQKYPDKEMEYMSLMCTGKSSLYCGKTEEAVALFLKAMDIAMEQDDEKKYMKTKCLLVMAQNYGTLYNIHIKREMDERMFQLLEKYEYWVNLSYMLAICENYNYEDFENIEDIEHKIPMTIRGVQIAKMLGNEHHVRGIYSLLIMRTSNAGYHEFSNYINEMLLSSLSEENIVVAYNCIGTGYSYSAIGNHQKSHNFYCRALKICYREKDLSHLAEVYYNMSANAIMVEDYKKSLEFLNMGIKIMETMDYEKLFACDIVKLYSLRAFCLYKSSNIYSSLMELKKVKRNIDFSPEEEQHHEENLFFYFYLKALLQRSGGQYEESVAYFLKAGKFMELLGGKLFFNYVNWGSDLAETYRIMGRSNEAQNLINRMIKYCDENKFTEKKKRILNRFMDEKLTMDSYDFQTEGISSEQVLNLLETELLKKNRERYESEREFLGEWEKIMNGSHSTFDELFEEASELFMHNYGVDGLIVIKSFNNVPKGYVKGMKDGMKREKLFKIREYFLSGKYEFVTNTKDRNFSEYADFIGLCECGRVYSFFTAPFWKNEKLDYIVIAFNLLHSVRVSKDSGALSTLKLDELQVYMRLFSQFISTTERIQSIKKIEDMNKKLLSYLRNDLLTGLLNRNGMYEQLDKLLNGLRKGSQERFLSVLYIDLDNFKYCNDNFGHQTGDRILKAFAKILLEVSKKKGDAIRYGGDEFLILVYEKHTKDTIIRMAEGIFERLRQEGSFQYLIENMVGRSVEILDKNRLSCSIGIAQMEINSKTTLEKIENTINLADDVLYNVKRTSKNNYLFHS